MTLYDIGGHPVSLDVTKDDVDHFHKGVTRYRRHMPTSGGAAVTMAGLEAVLPVILDRVSAQLPAGNDMVTVELAPRPLEYADATDLAEVNQLAREGWRVHTAATEMDVSWFLLERECPSTPDTTGLGGC